MLVPPAQSGHVSCPSAFWHLSRPWISQRCRQQGHVVVDARATCRGGQQLQRATPKEFEVGKGGAASQPWVLVSEDDDDDSIPIEVQDAVGRKVMENRGDATRSGLISAFLKAGENLETRITKYHRYIDQQLLDKLQRRIDTAEFIEEDAGFIEALKLLHRRLDREVNPVTTSACDQLLAESLQRMELPDYEGSPDQREEILRVLAGAMGLADPTSEDLFDTAFSIAEGQQSWMDPDDPDQPRGEDDLPVIPMAEFLREAGQLRDGLQADCEALDQAITIRTQSFAWTMTSDSAAKETRDLVKSLEKRSRLRDHMNTLLELADSLVTRL